jgi:hypothetical protein
MDLDYNIVNTFLAALTALILAGIAYMNKTRTDAAVATQATNATIAATNTTLAAQAAPVAVNVNIPETYVPKDTRARDKDGNLTTIQQNCSEWWMDAGYNGPEPTDDEKKKWTDANAAYQNAVDTISNLAKTTRPELMNPKVAALIQK